MGSEIVERLNYWAAAIRVHADRSPSPGHMRAHADKVEEAAARITALEAMCEKMAGALEEIAERDILEVERFHEEPYCIPETGNEYTRRTPVFKRSVYQNAQDFQAIARETLAQYREADNGR